MITVGQANFRYTYWGAESDYDVGTPVGAWPHDTHHYHVISHRCGYGDDILAYCREHELFHHFLADRVLRSRSHVIWSLANELEPAPQLAIPEEALVQTFQRWVRANERPIIGGADWDALKADALNLTAECERMINDSI